MQKSRKKKAPKESHTVTVASATPDSVNHGFVLSPAIICAVLSLVLFINTTGHDFTVDDATVISRNDITKKGVSALPEIFTSSYRAGFWDRDEGMYRPLSIAMFAIEYQIWPENPIPGHLINILLFAITVMILFRFIFTLFGTNSVMLAFFSTLLFAIHPIHTEVVANIKSRDEILCLLFGLLSLVYLINYIDHKKRTALIISASTFFICFLSKESAVTLLGIVPLIVWYKDGVKFKDQLIPLTVFIFITAVYIGLRLSILGSLTGSAEHQLINNSLLGATSFGQQLGSAFMVIGKYLYLLFIPFPLSFDYSYDQIKLVDLFSTPSLIPMIIVVAALAWAFCNLYSRNAAAFGILFFAITLSLVSNLIFLIESTMAERFLYIPSVGFCIAAGWGIQKLSGIGTVKGNNIWPSLKAKPLSILILAPIVIGYGTLTINRNSYWKDNITLLEKDVRTCPNSARIRYAYGSALLIEFALKENDISKKNLYLDKSIVQLEKGVSILSTYSEAWYHLGLAYKERGNGDKAVSAFETARSQKTFDKADFYVSSGIAYGMVKKYNSAISDLNIAISMEPENAEAYNNLGLYYSEKGVADSALTSLEIAIKLKPQFPQAWYNKGNTYAAVNSFDKAIQAYQTALEQDPGYTDATLNMGNCYAAMQNYSQAIRYFEIVVEKEPYNKKALINLGITYKILGDESKGQEYIDRAQSL